MTDTAPATQSLESSAMEIVKSHSYMALASGFVPVPVLDLAAVTGFQLHMLSKLAALYALPFSADRGKAIIGSLVGGVAATNLAYGAAGSLVKALPIVGWAAGIVTMPAMAYASTYALGKVFVTHFASGGTVLNFDVDKVREHFAQEFAQAKANTPKPGTPEWPSGGVKSS